MTGVWGITPINTHDSGWVCLSLRKGNELGDDFWKKLGFEFWFFQWNINSIRYRMDYGNSYKIINTKKYNITKTKKQNT